MNSWQIVLLAVILSGVEGKVGSKTQAIPHNWRRWDNCQVIMWSTGEPKDLSLWFERLKEMGCTAEECYRGRDSTPFVQHDFRFYAPASYLITAGADNGRAHRGDTWRDRSRHGGTGPPESEDTGIAEARIRSVLP